MSLLWQEVNVKTFRQVFKMVKNVAWTTMGVSIKITVMKKVYIKKERLVNIQSVSFF